MHQDVIGRRRQQPRCRSLMTEKVRKAGFTGNIAPRTG
jgi:hypothetical protein